jgi:hypothetical protein
MEKYQISFKKFDVLLWQQVYYEGEKRRERKRKSSFSQSPQLFFSLSPSCRGLSNCVRDFVSIK